MAEGDFNLATLWLPVAPETSKVGPAMEQAGKDAKTKFGQGIKGVGDTVHHELAKVGGKAKDLFTKTGLDSGKALTTGFQQGTRDLDKIPAPLRGIAENAQHATSGVRNLSSAFSGLRSGDVSGTLDSVDRGLKGIDDSAKKVGFDLGDWTQPVSETISPLQDVTNEVSGIKNDVHDFAETFKNMPGVIGKVGTALQDIAPQIATFLAIGDHMSEIQSFFRDQGFQGANPPGEKGGSDWTWDWFHPWDIPGKANSWWPFKHDWNANHPAPNTPFFDDQGRPLDASGKPFGPTAPGAAGPLGPPSTPPHLPYPTTRPPNWQPHNFYKDWYGPGAQQDDTPAPSTGSGGGGRPSYTKPNIGGVSSRSDLRAAGSRIAYLYQVAQSLEGTPYNQQLRNDCSGMVSQLAAAALGLPPPSAGERFTTVNEGQWLFSHGFRPGVGPPGSLQIGWYDHGGGNAGHTAATLPGGEHAESGGSHGNFLVGPGAAGADNPEFEHHAYLPMDGSAGGMGTRPLGSKSDPMYVSSADGESGGQSGGPWESQGQQLGQGLVNGIAEIFGVDGSVFKGFGSGKGILDFGAVKLGGGLLNWGMQMAQARGASGGGSEGLPIGGDGISLPGLNMIPGVGGMISRGMNAAAQGPKDAVPAGGNTTVNIHGDVNSGFNVTQHGVQDGVASWKEQYNAQPQRYASQGLVPNSGGGPAI